MRIFRIRTYFCIFFENFKSLLGAYFKILWCTNSYIIISFFFFFFFAHTSPDYDNSDVFRFQATDKDTEKHGKIQYSLRGNDAQDFVVNPETGTIYCTRPVDDRNVNKTFDVVAKDNDGKPDGLESVLAVTVSKKNHPYFKLPPP